MPLAGGENRGGHGRPDFGALARQWRGPGGEKLEEGGIDLGVCSARVRTAGGSGSTSSGGRRRACAAAAALRRLRVGGFEPMRFNLGWESSWATQIRQWRARVAAPRGAQSSGRNGGTAELWAVLWRGGEVGVVLVSFGRRRRGWWGCQFGPSRDGGGVPQEQGRRRPWRAVRFALSDAEEGSALGNGELKRGNRSWRRERVRTA